MPAKPERLKRRAQFLRAAAGGRKAALPGLVLQRLERGDEAPVRVGFTTTRKLGGAVLRNRARRRLREAARLVLAEQGLPGTDLVLIGREGTRARRFVDLLEDLRRALRKTAPSGTAGGQARP
jgi:ribonuclease P protein component